MGCARSEEPELFFGSSLWPQLSLSAVPQAAVPASALEGHKRVQKADVRLKKPNIWAVKEDCHGSVV